MKIEVSNLEIFERVVEKRIKAIGAALEPAIESEAQVVKQRTQQGLDVYGRPFAEYSQRGTWNWRDVRIKNKKQVGYVDLTFKGDMFNALKTIVKRDGSKFLASIFFNDRKQSQKAKGHHTGQLGRTKFKARKFFGLSQRQRETIVSKIRNAK